MNVKIRTCLIYVFVFSSIAITADVAQAQNKTSKPNIIIIYTDDVGYGDVSSYGASKIRTPNIDRIAAEGLRFTRAYATSATCTPSRWSLLTGKYAWRQQGTGIARGNAGLLIPMNIKTLPGMLQQGGYTTGVVGKWHLGLGPEEGPDWNGAIKPGPLEIGFNYSFLIPATGDRVPTVYVENHRVVGLDPADPIKVSYEDKLGDQPTGKENPELLKMKFSHGHDMTIVNGISRIGYMTGGKAAHWVDEDVADVITEKAASFIKEHKNEPFFLFFSTHDIHVPRVPHSRFAGKSGMGPRGDVLLQLDWSVGEILDALDEGDLASNTLLIFTSDNGPVVDDGYEDQAVELLGGHTPAGSLRGGKYSAFEAGTRVPFIVRWPGQVKKGASDALFSQVDLYASLASLVNQKITANNAPDSFDHLQELLGKSKKGRDYVIQQSLNNTLSIVSGKWKYISPSQGAKVNPHTNTELGNDPEGQLYDLEKDEGERENVAAKYPGQVEKLAAELKRVRDGDARRH